jgi:uncharacterized protein (TIGR02246 family)
MPMSAGRLLPVPVLSAVLAIAGCTSGPADTSAADTEAINRLRSDYIAAVNAEDVEKTLALYTEDAVRLEPNMPAVKGREAIRQGLAAMMAAFDVDMSLTSEELVVNGGWAFDRGQYMNHLMPKDPKQQMVMDQGKYLVILRKQPDGAWRVAREMGNSNIPLPPAPTAPAAK